MAHFRLLFPNSKASAVEDLNRVGLGGLLRDDDWKPSVAQGTGPKGIRGTIVSWDPNTCRPDVESPRYEFNPEIDIATEAPGDPINKLPQGRFWLLTEKTRPVTPADLKRKPVDSFEDLMPKASESEAVRTAKANRLRHVTRYAGNDVTLGDGNVWTFPNMTELPSSYRLTETGTWGDVVKPAFRNTYDRMIDAFNACQQHVLYDCLRDMNAEQIAEYLDDDDREFLRTTEPKALDQQVAIPFLCDMLALNYRVTPWIISELCLLDPTNHWAALEACTDAHRLRLLWQTVQKKTAPIRQRTPTGNSGETDS